ncbi:MAG: hypothetical protein N2C14_07825 [Planctomycetales bacterium]
MNAVLTQEILLAADSKSNQRRDREPRFDYDSIPDALADRL